MNIPVIVLLVVFVLIAVRQVGRIRLQIWQIMLGGAVLVLLSGRISPKAALHSVNLDVMLFLFGMFVVGEALERSGFLFHLSSRLFARTRSVDQLLLLVLFAGGIASAFLMNDTLAIIGTPVMLRLSQKHKISARLLLLTLAFAITIGSVMSPIGNPQNLLIAVNGRMAEPFVSFFKYLFLPTIINLAAAFLLLKIFYRHRLKRYIANRVREPIEDHRLAFLSAISLALILTMVVAKLVLVFIGGGEHFRLTYIALTAAFPVLVFSQRRLEILRNIDWRTLIFFAGMFILMESVWDSGFFQQMLSRLAVNIKSSAMVLAVSISLSQLISNVPLAALYLPMLIKAGAGVKEMVALAAGSTVAGNLFILGAASNVIIIQNGEKKAGKTLTFLEFARIGVPLTIINAVIYWLFLK